MALKNNIKLEYQEKHIDKINFLTKNNIKYKNYINYIFLDYI